ncbi:hypothetical protein JCM10207_000271 [Rhodosporidiobolus poonsookiae]
MPVGHRRINAKEADPNPNITFIRALEGRPDSDKALDILKALAAQVRPIMKEWGFGVNSLVEHEWNPQFAGRNWNAGEVIELVLRRRDGSFAPYMFLLRVMCHELAHCREMNHSTFFKRVNDQIVSAMLSLREKGYYGDGFWSTGQVLTSYSRATVPLSLADEPTYTCGGANRKRGGWRRRRAGPEAGPSRPRGSAVKLGTSGRQTSLSKKAGSRVTRKGAFEGDGQALDSSTSTKGRRAQAKGAVAARAAAAEARLTAEKREQVRELGVSPERKPKLEDLDSAMDEPFEGWETDEEDKPDVKLEDDEKQWLKDEMSAWREEGDGLATRPSAGRDGRGTSKGKKRKEPSPSSSPTAGTSAGPSRHRPTPSLKAQRDDLSDLQLTPEERAWLAADAAVKEEEDDEDDEIEIVSGKKARVAYMAMPRSLGGTGGGKKAICDPFLSDGAEDELPIPSSILRSPTGAGQKAPTVSSGIFSPDGPAKASTTGVRFKEGNPAPPGLKPKPKPRRVVQPSDSDSDSSKRDGPSKPRRVVHPSDSDSDSKSSKRPGPSSGKSKKTSASGVGVDGKSSDDTPPAKKPRKVRSDKGVKRGPRKSKDPRTVMGELLNRGDGPAVDSRQALQDPGPIKPFSQKKRPVTSAAFSTARVDSMPVRNPSATDARLELSDSSDTSSVFSPPSLSEVEDFLDLDDAKQDAFILAMERNVERNRRLSAKRSKDKEGAAVAQ